LAVHALEDDPNNMIARYHVFQECGDFFNLGGFAPEKLINVSLKTISSTSTEVAKEKWFY